jgi:hypothetical protein
MLYTLRFFFSYCSLFHIANFFGSCIFTFYIQDVLKLKKNSGVKGLNSAKVMFRPYTQCICCPVSLRTKERLFPCRAVTGRFFFGAFAKLRKATISFVKHVCTSIHPINRGSILDSGKRLSPPLEGPDRFWPPSSLLFNRYWRLCSWIQQPERESDHSYPSSDELTL